MLSIKCKTPDSIKLNALKPFQGDLKKRTTKDVEALAESIQRDGLLMPFVVWKKSKGEQYLLDGHGRLAALTELALKDASILDIDFPCLFIDAATEEEAKKDLLQITSSYGRVTRDGAVKFCATIPTYTAPAVAKFIREPVKRPRKEKQATETILRIAVPMDKIADVTDILSKVSFIKIL